MSCPSLNIQHLKLKITFKPPVRSSLDQADHTDILLYKKVKSLSSRKAAGDFWGKQLAANARILPSDVY